MALLICNGTELALYFDTKLRALVSVRSNGVRLYRKLGSTWKVLARKKADAPLESWKKQALELRDAQPAWAQRVKNLPTLETLMRWEADGKCKTPTGAWVEPDGQDANGVPSWLRVLGFI